MNSYVKCPRHRGLLTHSSLGLAVALLVVQATLAGAAAVKAPPKQYRIGVLISRPPFDKAFAGLREGLSSLGYREGENVAFEIEDAHGDVPSLPALAGNLAAAKPDVIFTIATAATEAVKQATATLPIVFTVVADPLRSGLVASYASSHNNLTGVANSAAALSGKRLELLQEIIPGLKRLLVLVASQESVAEVSFQFLAEVAPKLGIELLRRDVASPADIERVLAELPYGSSNAIFHVPSNLVGAQIDLLIHRALKERIPFSVHEDVMVERGALVSLGTDIRLVGVQAAKLVAKILQGEKPEQLPIQSAEKLSTVINLSTAKAIGLNIPQEVLERTDRFVE